MRSIKRTALIITSKRTLPAIMKSLEMNARESMATRQTPSITKVILSKDQVVPCKKEIRGKHCLIVINEIMKEKTVEKSRRKK